MIPLYIKKKFLNGHERSIKAKKNILLSFLFKGGSILINLVLVPLTLEYLNPTKYGVWLTIGSIVGMLSFFDIGMGNGLRNKFAELKAKGANHLAKEYISTTYAVLLLISVGLFIVFNIIYPLINWTSVVNASPDFGSEVGKTIYIVFSFFCLQFVFSIIGTILTADQKPSANNFLNLSYNVLSLIAVYFISRFTNGSLFYLGIAVAGMPTLVFFISSLFLFRTKYKIYSPKLSLAKFEQVKEITGIGVKFFVIQISYVIMFSTSNIIISQTLSPAEVTPYNIAFKYFGIVTMAYTILISPFWSAFTDAYHKNDMKWIKSIMRRLNQISIIIFFLLIIMVLLSGAVYKFWIGNNIKISIVLSTQMALYVFITALITPYLHFMNGIGKVKLQLILSIFASILNIPITLFFTVYMSFGLYGIIMGPIICLLPFAILIPIQYQKVLNNKALGIWNK